MDWQIKKRRCICNFLVNSPKGTVYLSSVDTSNMSKTVDKVFEMLDAIVERIEEENVVQVVTDNAANYKAVEQLLMEKKKEFVLDTMYYPLYWLDIRRFWEEVRGSSSNYFQGKENHLIYLFKNYSYFHVKALYERKGFD